MTRRAAAAIGTFALLFVLSGCSLFDRESPHPSPTVRAIPWMPDDAAELACGMSTTDLERYTGYRVGHIEGDVSLPSGEAQVTCIVWPEGETWFDGPMVFVTLATADSAAGRIERAYIDGTAKRVPPPHYPYTEVDGGAWRYDLDLPPSDEQTSGGSSSVFFGEVNVSLTSRTNVSGRDLAADHLALSEQVASSLGLTRSPSPRPSHLRP